MLHKQRVKETQYLYIYTVNVGLLPYFFRVSHMFCTLIRLLSWPLNLESSFTDLSVETALFGLGRDASSSEITV